MYQLIVCSFTLLVSSKLSTTKSTNRISVTSLPYPHKVLPAQKDWTIVEDGVLESAEYWAIKLKYDVSENETVEDEELDQIADQVAEEHNLINEGQIGALRGHYLFKKIPQSSVLSEQPKPDVNFEQNVEFNPSSNKKMNKELKLHPHIEWHSPQMFLKRNKRDILPRVNKPTNLNARKSRSFELDNPIESFNLDYLDGQAVLPQENEVEVLVHRHSQQQTIAQQQSFIQQAYFQSIRERQPLFQAPTNFDYNAVYLQNTQDQHESFENFEVAASLADFIDQPELTNFIDNTLPLDDEQVFVIPPSINEPEKKVSNRVSVPEPPPSYISDYEDDYVPNETLLMSDAETFLAENIMHTNEHDLLIYNIIRDPEFPNQWHLKNRLRPTFDCNVTSVWAYNITGSGVTVAVVDDGVQWSHPDLLPNYSPEGSYDLNDKDANPMPQLDDREENKHGTRCAGEIAAAPNNICGVGVAFGAKFSGIRVLDGPITDSMEATAFTSKLSINDIYSCSWGPEDDGKTLDGPHPLAQAALIHGISVGRRGFGTIYVVASGNGGAEGDNCNFDGYANSIYTVTIGAVDERGEMPYYAEECAAMLASTFSSGASPARKIVTTDWTLGSNANGCTSSHTGTSAATPLAAGMLALALQVRPCLTWRDVQHLTVFTARKPIQPSRKRKQSEWITNAAGFQHSVRFGFGLLDAWRLVNAALVWNSVPTLTSFSPLSIGFNEKIPMGAAYLRLPASVLERDVRIKSLNTLEHVQVTVNIDHSHRGHIEISLICPSGTPSLLAPARYKDDSIVGFRDWTFSTVRCWGEPSNGTFYLIVRDRGNIGQGVLRYWRLNIYGNSWTQQNVQEQKILVDEAISGQFLKDPELLKNFTAPCPPGDSIVYDISGVISERTLKLLAILSAMFVFWSVYYSLEMAMCINEERFSLENFEIRAAGKQSVDFLKMALNPSDGSTALIAVEGDEDLIAALGDSTRPTELILTESTGSSQRERKKKDRDRGTTRSQRRK